MSTDRREYIRVCVDLPLSPKLAGLDDPAAGWLYVTSMCYCGRELTDGVFPIALVLRLAGVEKDRAEALAGAGLWHLPGHDCPDCAEPEMGSAVIHDYLKHQRSKAEAEATRASKSAAGAKGAAKRWGSKRDASPMAPAIAPVMAGAIADECQSDSKTMPEVEGEVTSYSVASRAAQKRGTRIPDDFAVTPEMVAWAREKTPTVDGARETEKFINFWQAKSGKDATKLDWVATWRNWMLTAAERAPRHLRPVQGSGLKRDPHGNVVDPRSGRVMDR